MFHSPDAYEFIYGVCTWRWIIRSKCDRFYLITNLVTKTRKTPVGHCSDFVDPSSKAGDF